MAAVWDGSNHSGSELLMLLAIADFADDDGRAYPSIATLARKCRMSPRNVNHILPRLTASGELTIKVGNGPSGTNVYRVNLSHLSGVKPASGVKSSSGVKPASAPPEAGFLNPLKPASPKPSLNHQEPPISCSSSKNAGLFERFWQAYPRKVGKKKAAGAFRRLKVDDSKLSLMLAALAQQAQSAQWLKDDGRFIPHATTWLNQERWNDEDGPVATPSAAQWFKTAGFGSIWEAENCGCTERNHKSFKGGRKVAA